MKSAVVAGGGIAGIACALRLAERGVRVTLLETRKKLGGRATSFVDVRTGETIDNCQHVALACCTNYLDLLQRLGAADRIQWHREQYWVEPGGRVSVVRPGGFPAPLHFASSVLRASFLTLGEAALLGRAMRAIMRADRAAWRARTFGEFLRDACQSERVVRRFWAPVVVSACNLDVGRVSAESALHVFQEGFLANSRSAEMGLPTVPLVELYDRAEGVIARAGGVIRLGVSVTEVSARSVRATIGTEPVEFPADAVVSALPVERLADVVSQSDRQRDDRFARLGEFEHSPILGVHVRFDRPVINLPHAVLVEGATQWLFRKDDAGSALHAVVSAADEWMPLSERQIAERIVGDIQAYFPDSVGASVVSLRAVKEKRATFAPTPAVQAIRPGPTGPSGIVLAGDWTDTGWPATMEGATRSGYVAAASVLGEAPGALLARPLAVGRVARLLGLRSAPVGAYA
ncbi:MAG: hydroxysqualene dehydroxylase HpnE [Phycisphaeraceae bacterium]|nr:hydroxysqualene dehydroxylase HpnE [Phycisphaeraceae bacterium]